MRQISCIQDASYANGNSAVRRALIILEEFFYLVFQKHAGICLSWLESLFSIDLQSMKTEEGRSFLTGMPESSIADRQGHVMFTIDNIDPTTSIRFSGN